MVERSPATGGRGPADPAGAGGRKGRPQRSALGRIPRLTPLPYLLRGRDEEATGRKSEEK